MRCASPHCPKATASTTRLTSESWFFLDSTIGYRWRRKPRNRVGSAQRLQLLLMFFPEDLAQSPEAVCNQICSFLGVDYQATMLDSRHFHQRHRGVVSHHRLYAPIDAARIGVYKQSLSVEQRNSFEHQAREALEVFGYKHFEAPDVISWNRARRSSSGKAHSANRNPSVRT